MAWEENPQSALATTFCLPTRSAKRTIRSAMVSGCPTMLVAWLKGLVRAPGRACPGRERR